MVATGKIQQFYFTGVPYKVVSVTKMVQSKNKTHPRHLNPVPNVSINSIKIWSSHETAAAVNMDCSSSTGMLYTTTWHPKKDKKKQRCRKKNFMAEKVLPTTLTMCT